MAVKPQSLTVLLLAILAATTLANAAASPDSSVAAAASNAQPATELTPEQAAKLRAFGEDFQRNLERQKEAMFKTDEEREAFEEDTESLAEELGIDL